MKVLKVNNNYNETKYLSYILKMLYETPQPQTYTPEMVELVKIFQKENDLTPDGIVGPLTWSALLDKLREKILSQENIADNYQLKEPPLYKDLYKIFGDFKQPNWYNENIKFCDLSPFFKELSHVKNLTTKNGFGFYCHKLVIPKFIDAFKLIIERKLSKEIKTYDGCYNVRLMTSGKKYSTHSWGISIDLNASTNGYGNRNYDMHPGIIESFEKIGFESGAKWNTPDAMHFQYCRSN